MSTPKHPPLAAPGAATPTSFTHLPAFSSPAPRSVQSPATAPRAQAGKSPGAGPATTPAQPAAAAAATAALNHPTGRLTGSSPAAAMLGFDSPAALGMGLGGALDGGVGMSISMSGMSGLGLGAGMGMGMGMGIGGRVDDEERRRRLEAVVAVLARRPGRVGREGVERLARKHGFEYQEDTKDVRADVKKGRKLLTIAGQTVLIDINLRMNTVENVALSFPGLSDAVNEHAQAASRILQDDLTAPPPGKSSINLTLDRFAGNLERIARLDKLSKPEANCFEAISGVYTSLKRLYEHEKQAAEALFGAANGDTGSNAEREVMCKKSGRPNIHGGETFGMTIDYWLERRNVKAPRRRARSDRLASTDASAMDVDEKPGRSEDHAGQLFSLSIECESSPAELYPAMRVSDSWVSQPVGKGAGDPNALFDAPAIGWQDPPPTYVSPHDGQTDGMALDSSAVGKLPNVRFVAKLRPPLAMPLQTVVQVLTAVGVDVPPESIRPTTFEALALRPDAQEAETATTELVREATKEVRSEVTVLAVGADGAEAPQTHANTLFVPKVEYGRVLEEVPFVHPRQIVEILPTLRQYAFLTTLLQTSFPASPAPLGPSAAPTAPPDRRFAPPTLPTPPSSPSSAPRLPVDVALTVSTPSPHLTVVFPLAAAAAAPALDALLADDDDDADAGAAGASGTVALDVLPNAEVAVAAQSVFAAVDGEDGAAGEAALGAAPRLGRALDVCGDLGVWVEWMRREGGAR